MEISFHQFGPDSFIDREPAARYGLFRRTASACPQDQIPGIWGSVDYDFLPEYSRDALMKSRNRGCGFSGRDLNSG
jgi:hypothetical protein